MPPFFLLYRFPINAEMTGVRIMKIEPIFCVKENKLYKIEDNSIVDPKSLTKIEVKWSTVELQDEVYNEEYLAELRESLKRKDSCNEFVILCPIVDKPLESPEQIELFVNAMNHTARRIKDCICVVGVQIPVELKSPEMLSDVLSVKHGHYIYFKDDTVLS